MRLAHGRLNMTLDSSDHRLRWPRSTYYQVRYAVILVQACIVLVVFHTYSSLVDRGGR